MINRVTSIYLGAMLLVIAADLRASLVVDTGAPSGNGFALALDGNDRLAGQVHFNSASQINSVQAYLDGGDVGDSFTVSLYDDAWHLPQTPPRRLSGFI